MALVERLLAAGADTFQRTYNEEYKDALQYAQLGKLEGHHKSDDYDSIIYLLRQQHS